jgi:hypothetical protein
MKEIKIGNLANGEGIYLGDEALIHKFSGGDNNEITTSLQIDYWERNEKSGFGIIINKDKTSLSVPLSKIDFMFFSAFLERISVDAVFEKRVEKAR